MKNLTEVHLTQKEFELGLETSLTILEYPNKENNYYLCEYSNYYAPTKKVKVYIAI